MGKKPILPQVVFALSILFAVVSAALSLERFKLENRIQATLDEFRQEQQSILGQAEQLRAQGRPEISLQQQKLASYFDTRCRFVSLSPACEGDRRNLVGIIPKPAEGASVQVVQMATASADRILDTSKQLSKVSDKREQLEKPAGVDKDIIRGVLSAVLVLAALFIVLSKRYPEASEKWAFATIGTIIGYWLG